MPGTRNPEQTTHQPGEKEDTELVKEEFDNHVEHFAEGKAITGKSLQEAMTEC